MSAIETNFCPFPGFLFSFAFPMFLKLMRDHKKDFYLHKQILIDYGTRFEGILAFFRFPILVCNVHKEKKSS